MQFLGLYLTVDEGMLPGYESGIALPLGLDANIFGAVRLYYLSVCVIDER